MTKTMRRNRIEQHQQLMHDLHAAKRQIENEERQVMQCKITILIPFEQADRASELLGSSVSELPPEDDTRVLEWHTSTTRRGDDETIVVTLSHALPEIPWDIDWQRSKY